MGVIMMYKIIACDLDETLLDDRHEVSARNVQAIQKARELGVHFVPATGRGYNSIGNTLQDLGLQEKQDEYVISFNGGAITENKDSRLMELSGISFEEAREIFARGLNYDVCIHIYTQHEVYVYNFVQSERDYLAGHMEVKEIFAHDIEFLRGQEIVKALYMNTDQEYLRRIESELKDVTGDMDVSFSSNRYIEFNRRGVNKGKGLLKLAELLGVDPADTIAIGDNFNDLSMLRAAGLGIGVRNAAEGIRDYCDFITQATNNEHAIAEVIEKFVLC